MAKVTIKDITEGDSLNIEDVNETITSWNDASKQINGDNVRVQGLDQRVFGPVIRKPPPPFTAGSTSGWISHPVTALFSQVSMGAGDAIIKPYWNPIDGDRLVVRASLQFYSVGNGEKSDGYSNSLIGFRLEYGDGLGNWYELFGTKREFAMSEMYTRDVNGWVAAEQYGFNTQNSPKGNTRTEQNCTIVHLVDMSEVAKVDISRLRFRIAYRTLNVNSTIIDASPVYIGFLNLNSTTYRR